MQPVYKAGFPPVAKAFVQSLLEHDVTKRLGCLKHGVSRVARTGSRLIIMLKKNTTQTFFKPEKNNSLMNAINGSTVVLTMS